MRPLVVAIIVLAIRIIILILIVMIGKNSKVPTPSIMGQVRQARLIIGAHGGAMANMVLAQSDAGM